ncbi:MAG TPA: formimidoylglutamase [Hanamia sp.]|nr:formimidoylglutamase [Hanamia sp.]
MPAHFKRYDKQDIFALTHTRKYETKLGEIILCGGSGDFEKTIAATEAKYVVFGIPEDIGVKANLGKGGAASSWFSFLDAFLNIQSNDFLSGDNIFLAGHFDFSDAQRLINVNAATEEEKIMAYRSFVSKIDDAVEEMVKIITQYQKIPIIVGGGHNNAYPAIKGAAKGLYKAELLPLAQINCINLDAHTDYRPIEGRHSGNPFRYADEDGYLNKYCVIGVHENYLQQNVWIDIVNNPFTDFITYEDIFIHEKKSFTQSVAHAAGFTEDNYTGIELDLDAIQNTLSSASTPSGISALHARQYLNLVATDAKVAYVHICEGATKLDTGETSSSTGKLISYLVSDFVKAHGRQA